MAIDSLRRRTPLGPMAERLRRTCSSARFVCREQPFRVITDVRCASTAMSAAADTMGVDPPSVGEVVVTGASTVIGLGPGWWMVDAPDGSAPLDGSVHVSAVDVSAQYASLLLQGTSVRDVLAHGTTSDLHPDHLLCGRAVQAVLAKAGITLARTGVDEFRLWVQASYARYLATWLMDASLEYR
jgi:sarcosine oxidase subunit gamma